MTAQKKVTPTLKQRVDDLIAQGHAPAILSMYVELMGEAMRLQECLKVEHPQVLQAVAGLVPQTVPLLQQPMMAQTPGSSWNPLMGGVPTIPPTQGPMIQPGLQEPFGTIHSEVPATYEYPMDNAGLEYQQAVMNALAVAPPNPPPTQGGGLPVGYETLDPQEGVV